MTTPTPIARCRTSWTSGAIKAMTAPHGRNGKDLLGPAAQVCCQLSLVHCTMCCEQRPAIAPDYHWCCAEIAGGHTCWAVLRDAACQEAIFQTSTKPGSLQMCADYLGDTGPEPVNENFPVNVTHPSSYHSLADSVNGCAPLSLPSYEWSAAMHVCKAFCPVRDPDTVDVPLTIAVPRPARPDHQSRRMHCLT